MTTSNVRQLHERVAAYGAASLSDQELVTLVLRSKDAAERMFSYGGGWPDKLAKVLETEKRTPCVQLLASAELGRRMYKMPTTEDSALIRGAHQVVAWCFEMKHLKHEVVRVLYMSARLRIIHDEVVSVGTTTATLFSPRSVIEPGVRLGANGMIVCHNHPSGDPSPSNEDVAITKQVESAAAMMGMTLYDHVIIGLGNPGYISMKEMGLI